MFFYLTGSVRYEFKTKQDKDAWLWFTYKKAVSNRSFDGPSLKSSISEFIQRNMEAKHSSWIYKSGEFDYRTILEDILNYFKLKSISLEVWDKEQGLSLEN